MKTYTAHFTMHRKRELKWRGVGKGGRGKGDGDDQMHWGIAAPEKDVCIYLALQLCMYVRMYVFMCVLFRCCGDNIVVGTSHINYCPCKEDPNFHWNH